MKAEVRVRARARVEARARAGAGARAGVARVCRRPASPDEVLDHVQMTRPCSHEQRRESELILRIRIATPIVKQQLQCLQPAPPCREHWQRTVVVKTVVDDTAQFSHAEIAAANLCLIITHKWLGSSAILHTHCPCAKFTQGAAAGVPPGVWRACCFVVVVLLLLLIFLGGGSH